MLYCLTAAVYKLYLCNLTTSTTTTVRMIRTATPATAAPAASPTDEELEVDSLNGHPGTEAIGAKDHFPVMLLPVH